MALKTEKISQLEVLESAEGTRVLVEQDGKYKRVDADKLGGGKVKTVNGAEPDENGNVKVEIPETPDWVATKEREGGDFVHIPEQQITGNLWNNLQMSLQPDLFYDVYINGKVYTCDARADGSFGGAVLGNDPSLTLNDYPFCITWAGGTAKAGMFFANNDISYPVTLKVTDRAEYVYEKMPEEYLPDGVVKSVNGTEPDADGNVEIEVSGGGGVDVTASVGQTIVVEEVDANGKPTQWKAAEYQEKICGTEWYEIVPLTEFTPEYNSTFGAPMASLNDFEMIAGNKYKVIYDGAEYICEAGHFIVNGLSLNAVGNQVLAGGEDTGEPFALGKVDGASVGFIFSMDMNAHSIQVFSEVAIPIPVQYVSNAFPYYIEVTGDGSEDNPLVCNDTVANVEAIYKSGRPIKVKFGGYKNTMTMIPLPLPYAGYAMDMFIFIDPILAESFRFSPYGYTFGFFCPGIYDSADNNLLWLSPNEDGTYFVSDTIPGDESN